MSLFSHRNKKSANDDTPFENDNFTSNTTDNKANKALYNEALQHNTPAAGSLSSLPPESSQKLQKSLGKSPSQTTPQVTPQPPASQSHLSQSYSSQPPTPQNPTPKPPLPQSFSSQDLGTSARKNSANKPSWNSSPSSSHIHISDQTISTNTGSSGISATQQCRELAQKLNKRFALSLVGQAHLRDALVTALIAGGHVLIESVPGLAKTTAAQTLATSVQGTFKRIQCTPDLMPSDLIGTQIYNFASQQFSTRLGPIHANFVLLDEINRANAKTQSAMLEAMAEKQTTIGGERFTLPQPFMVIATENPIEQEGTFNLPEAQMDRFMIKTVLTYPTIKEEEQILALITGRGKDNVALSTTDDNSLSLRDVEFLRKTAREVHVAPSIMSYCVSLVSASRGLGLYAHKDISQHIRLGASPRASIALIRMAQATALLASRDYVIPEDVKLFAYDILRHRIILHLEALADNISVDDIIEALVQVVPVP